MKKLYCFLYCFLLLSATSNNALMNLKNLKEKSSLIHTTFDGFESIQDLKSLNHNELEQYEQQLKVYEAFINLTKFEVSKIKISKTNTHSQEQAKIIKFLNDEQLYVTNKKSLFNQSNLNSVDDFFNDPKISCQLRCMRRVLKIMLFLCSYGSRRQ